MTATHTHTFGTPSQHLHDLAEIKTEQYRQMTEMFVKDDQRKDGIINVFEEVENALYENGVLLDTSLLDSNGFPVGTLLESTTFGPLLANLSNQKQRFLIGVFLNGIISPFITVANYNANVDLRYKVCDLGLSDEHYVDQMINFCIPKMKELGL